MGVVEEGYGRLFPLHRVERLKVLELIRAGCWEEALDAKQGREEDSEMMGEQEATRTRPPPTQLWPWQDSSRVAI